MFKIVLINVCDAGKGIGGKFSAGAREVGRRARDIGKERARYREGGASDFPLPLEHLLRELIFHQYQTLFFKSRVAVYRLHIFLGSMYWWVENAPSPRC